MAPLSRRRFIQLAAACSATTALPLSAQALMSAKPQIVSWQGRALGAEASLSLAHEDQAFAKQVMAHCLKEIDRLESIFSLYREGSTLNQLNREKVLNNPPAELATLIETSIEFGEQSGGLFDVTIQPLWQLYHQHFMQPQASEEGPSADAIKGVLERIDYRKIEASPKAIRLPKGFEVTLNGIAQGYITDRISALLSKHGFTHALINLGEYQALGQHPQGRNWQVALPDAKQPWKIRDELAIPAGKALATSSSHGTRWSAKAHHLLSPLTGRPVDGLQDSLTVIANNATQADALATIFSLSLEPSVQKSLETDYGASVI